MGCRGGLIDRGGVGMGKVFQLVILQTLYSVLGGFNINRRLRVRGVECVLTLSANCFNENTY